nr:hypothetical protein [Tanacetum cinerariifolium]
MATTIKQQVVLDEALVPSTQRLRIGRSNFRLPSDIQSKESTLQLVYDVLRKCTFFKAFLVTADSVKHGTKNLRKEKQMKISELEECVRKKDRQYILRASDDFTIFENLRAQVQELHSENEHLKSKAVDFITFQTLQVQVTKLKSENEGLKLMVEELTKVREIVEATLRQRDELVSAPYEYSSLALDRGRKKVEDEIGSLETRLNYVSYQENFREGKKVLERERDLKNSCKEVCFSAGNGAVFIARKTQRLLWAVPAILDISRGRLSCVHAIMTKPRMKVDLVKNRDGLRVVIESVERVVLESRHWLHDGDLFQGVENFGGDDSPFVPYLDCW